MKIFLYSSPYKYYRDNLLPLGKRFQELGHDVYMSHSYKKDSSLKNLVETIDIHGATASSGYVKKFLKGDFNPDVVILTQAWWFLEDSIVKMCNQRNIPFYILDHAAPILAYSEKSGKKSHLYRNNTCGAKSHIVWGSNSYQIMKDRGCKSKMHILGSPRVEDFIFKKSDKKIKAVRKKYGDKIAVIYNTNDKMKNKDAKFNFKKVGLFLKSIGYTVIIKPHVRSTYNQKKLKDFVVFKDKRLEEQLIHASDLMLFTYPSSVMIFGAVAHKPIISLYGDHWCDSARFFSSKYSDIFLDLKSVNQIIPYVNQNNSYDYFIDENLKFSKKEKSVDRIIKFIINDI